MKVIIKIFKNIINWILLKIYSVIISISIALRNTEIDLLKVDPNNLDRKKKFYRRWFRRSLLEKFYAGQRDEKYIREYYELLRKADKFMLTASPLKKAIAADRWKLDYNQVDKHGRKLDHLGFFDEKHKYVGKTMEEAIKLEMAERRSDDDDYELIAIISNKPIPVGFSEISDGVDVGSNYNNMDLLKLSKKVKYPIKIVRNIAAINKIEELTDALHIKKIGFDHRQLEFFIPLKFKIDTVKENSQIFKELTDIDYVYVKDNYGELVGFNVDRFIKRIKYNDTHEIWKFHAVEMDTIKM